MLDSLRLFVLVAEHKSFTRAAQLAGLTRPAVSHHIKQLEEHFGLPLLVRTTRRVSVTRAGHVLRSHAREVLAKAEALETAMADLRISRDHHVMVGASTLPGENLLPRALATYRARRADPGIHFEVRVGNSDEVLAWLRSGEVDLGFVGCGVRDPDLACEPFAEDELVLAVPPDLEVPDPLPLARLTELPLIMRESGSATRKAVLSILAGHGFDTKALRVVAEMGSPEAVKSAVKAGIGCAFLSAMTVKSHELKAVRLEDVRLRRSVCACWRTDSPPSEAVRLLLEELAACSSQVGMP